MGPNKQQYHIRMLRYKTETRPGLVALYDIQPGNGSGQFLQPARDFTGAGITVSRHRTRYQLT